LLCEECNQVLPDGSQFCTSCGTSTNGPIVSRTAPEKSRRWSKTVIFMAAAVSTLLAFVAAAVVFQDSEIMQQIRDSVGSSEQLALGDSVLSLPAGGFSSHKFVIPAGVSNVVVRGEFAVSTVPAQDNRRRFTPPDRLIEVYVLNEAAFTVWHNGFSAGSEYESGQREEGTVRVQLPSEAGIYYLVFSNRISPRTAKTVRSDIMLSYKSWLPESFLTIKDRFMNWLNQ
jgi:hypothetical protein